ncbi:MAG TPA: hypothetical protein PK602_02300 [Methanothrix sp.]|nr:hypothetical protein [Methanothrix sp.]HQQ36911.1 hypothetical protein [Methanothrix sp.]
MPGRNNYRIKFKSAGYGWKKAVRGLEMGEAEGMSLKEDEEMKR